MVWIETNALAPRHYFPSVVEARRMAISYLEGNGMNRGEVDFFSTKGSAHSYEYVIKETVHGKAYYFWTQYTKKYGMIRVPLHKNGKIDRRRY